MKLILYILMLSAFSLSNSYAEEASNNDRGATLHNEHCAGCHINMTGGDGSMLYTRDARRVTSLAKLNTQVQRCETNIGLSWWDEDVAAVVKFLNDNYYRFPEK